MNAQLSSILILLISGMVLGIFFDVYRVFRGKISCKKIRPRGWIWINLAGDLCFWGLALVLITPVIFWGTWLELRLYVWLIMLGGIGLYFGVFSPVFIPFLLWLWRILSRATLKLKMAIWQCKIFLKKSRWRKNG